MNADVKNLWGEELSWIKDVDLREKIAKLGFTVDDTAGGGVVRKK